MSSQIGEHLGFIVNLRDGIFEVPKRKIGNLKKKAMNMKHLNAPTARTVSSLVGSIMSMGLALGSVTRMQTHALWVY